MKKVFLFAIAAAAVLVSCSSDDFVNEQVAQKQAAQVPIGFNVQKQNITRSSALEANSHYNFGVWAYKVNTAPAAQVEVMNHYLVGWSDESKGYNPAGATTFNKATSTQSTHTDYESPWFYEGLGSSEYADATGFYQTSNTEYMSNNLYQYLRYWDLAYEMTNFYCYAPYKHGTGVSFNPANETMTFTEGSSIRDGYDNPQNPDYDNIDRSLSEFMYGGKSQNNKMVPVAPATPNEPQDVDIAFKHMGAQLFIRFYENIPGYRVEIIDLKNDNTTANRSTNGIQAKAATRSGSAGNYSYAAGGYYKASGATIDFSTHSENSVDYTISDPQFKPTWTAAKSTDRLMFRIPAATAPHASITNHELQTGTTTATASYDNLIPEDIENLANQTYAYSPTIYYPVAQPTTGTPSGFTFHVSYKIIAEDNGEVIYVHDARVFVPAQGDARPSEAASDVASQWITAWQSNVKYTYTFKITKGTSGTTDPTVVPNPDAVDPTTQKALFPIVFDNATIEDYTTTNGYSDYNITDGTSY